MRRSLITLSLTVFLVVLSACGGRDLSTPSSRLVGHWHIDVALMNVTADAYFAPRDDEGIGTFAIGGSAAGLEGSGTYRVVSEEAEGEGLTCAFTLGSSGSEELSLVLPADGKTLKVRIPTPTDFVQALGPEMTLRLDYVDDRTEP